MKIFVSDIVYDTFVEGSDEMSAARLAKLNRAIKRLPDEMLVEIDDSCASYDFDDIVSEAIDKVSGRTGWLVQSSSVEMLRGSAPPTFVEAFNRFCRK